ncbi:hypothetical protein [Microbulbifer sp. VAAF005]|uniref:hypothetical protein n=1 Tax=Microbulbifer sp. VAAF005 TaxID=3034230 RepID=UPI0024ADE9A1|nr:hypothetical protein [Microbulbifer sp. VAAF005]WHI47340.1 hypothetical protein P0078_02870 [Microbulbifer sp. VAAF005]
MANGSRIPRTPFYYGMDISSYQKSVSTSKYLGRAGSGLGYFNYGLETYNYTVSASKGDYRAARASAINGFYGALMMAPPHIVTIPVGIVGILANGNYHADSRNP